MARDEPGKPDKTVGRAGALSGPWQGKNLRQPEQALEALREIERAKLELEAIERAEGHFADLMVNSLMLVGDLAGDAIRRIEAAQARGR
jgi:hypothetical protein